MFFSCCCICRSLSEEGPIDRASSAGSPPAAAPAAAGGERGSEGGDRRRNAQGPSLSPDRGPPSSLPLQSRLGDLRRRLQSKRAEPPTQ